MRLMILAALIPLAACGNGSDDTPGITGTGSGGARSYAVADFSGVELAGSDNVDVRVGAGFSVRAEGDPKQLERLRIRKIGEKLQIDRRKEAGFHWSKGDAVKIHVTMPRIASAGVSGSGDMTVDRIEGQKFDASVAGSGKLALAALAVDAAEMNIAGSGTLQAAGQAKRLEVNIAGSGDIDAPQLAAASADVSIAGSGNVRAAVNGPAEISMMGSGDVDLGPNARCKTSKMGSGNVRCG